MKILIIGGSGFLGRRIFKLLSLNYKNVKILDNKKTKNNLNYIVGDISNYEFLKKEIKNFDVVYHLAGLSDLDTAYKDPIKTAKTNILGTVNVLQACKVNQIKKFIFASTMYVSGNHGSFYRCSKAACEDYIKEYKKRFNLNYTILRFGSLYGPGSNEQNGLYRIISEALKSKKVVYYGDPNSQREYIHVDDAAQASIDCLNKFENKIINITGNQSLRVTDLLEIIREILSIKKNIKVINKKQKGHYTLVPHNYEDSLVMKYSINPFIDLGEGIKSLISYIKKKK